jgi:hypothetical protein
MNFKDNFHLTYCSNIHENKSWSSAIDNSKLQSSNIKKLLNCNSFGFGYRISNAHLEELESPQIQSEFINQLNNEGDYVFTINGFPYGNFHNTRVKDQVHSPDWTTKARVDYTIGLAEILSKALPSTIDGGISTSPLSYKPWHEESQLENIFLVCANNLVSVIIHLHRLYLETGKETHIDLEPEPDGLIENSEEFVSFYNTFLIPKAKLALGIEFNYSESAAIEILSKHFAVCFDVCHFSVVHEDVLEALNRFKNNNIRIGRLQISAALEADTPEAFENLKEFDEPTYLHQVGIKEQDGFIRRYSDLDQYLNQGFKENSIARVHYHVPIFLDRYKNLKSTQQDIVRILKEWKSNPFTNHLEVETYTFSILPDEFQLELGESIARELTWVLNHVK